MVDPLSGELQPVACTDNFQVRPFEFEGVKYYSCEQAYHAYKFPAGSSGRDRVCASVPREGEDDAAYGLRVWQAGQSDGRDCGAKVRDDWDQVKVGVLYSVNRAKYEAHPDLAEALKETYPSEIRGAPSTSWTCMGETHYWQIWNGLIQMRIREELLLVQDQAGTGGRAGGSCEDEVEDSHRRESLRERLEALVSKFEVAFKYASLSREEDAHLKPSFSAIEIFMQNLKRHGLKHPWNCPVCTFSNASFPSLCEVCDTKNPTYADALGALNREKGEFKCKAECTAEAKGLRGAGEGECRRREVAEAIEEGGGF